MKKNNKLLLLIAIPCAIVAAGYFALMMYYRQSIPFGTWINNIYCTGMSYDQAAELLLEESTHIVELDVIDYDDVSHHLTPDSGVYELTFRDGLAQKVAAFSSTRLFSEKHMEVSPEIILQEEALLAYLDGFAFFDRVSDTSQGWERLSIHEAPDGYVLIDSLEHVLDREKAYEVICDALQTGEKQVSLKEKGCYYKPDYTEADKQIIAQYEALQDFCNRFTYQITIRDRVMYTVDGSVLKDWILREADGSYAFGKGGGLQLDDYQLEQYVESISKEVTTYWGEPWDFINHEGESIQVKAGNFGRGLHAEALKEQLLAAYHQAESGSYELEFDFYPTSAKDFDFEAISEQSYVEVDLQKQQVYLYLDGELELTSPCVTGDVKRKRETPKGVFYVEYKQRNRTLRGPGYATPVSYWMHFYNHCGFHDAGWRDSFGGDIYLDDGSHGCVNMPPEKARELYEKVYKGLPVFVY